jgi:DNA-binding NarL/FixJ family response regulator
LHRIDAARGAVIMSVMARAPNPEPIPESDRLMPAPLPKGVTLRGLEVFESLARTGSVAATANELGLSAPAVSQQMKNLAAALGAELLDNSRRPMTLTPAGRVFLDRTEKALDSLRSGHGISTRST